jgi:PTS system nitrogen regulatory IIA component
MLISEILPVSRVEQGIELNSKKAVLEYLAGMLAAETSTHSSNEVFESLIARERLGSTGLGHGISIPHGRMNGLEKTMGAFLKIDAGVDFDAMDGQPVDMFFALLVPEECTDEHLKLLAQLAERFSKDNFLNQLRAAPETSTTQALLINGN